MSDYTYTTLTRIEGEPTYTFAEVKYGKIVSINQHWVPLAEYRKFFEASALFIDVTGVLIDGEPPAIGDIVTTGEYGYEIQHFKSVFSVAETKAYRIELLKLQRDVKETDLIEYNGVLFDADKNALTRMDKARQSLVDNGLESITWTAADNSRVELSVADFAGINTALAYRSNQLHVRYNELKDYIYALDGEKYLPLIMDIGWDWDMDADLDALLAAKQAEEPEA